MQCVCGQDRQCVRQQTEPLEGDLQPIDTFQYSATLPASTGENKYTENMTPGYTGKTRSGVYISEAVLYHIISYHITWILLWRPPSVAQRHRTK